MTGVVQPPDDKAAQLQARMDALEATFAQRDAALVRRDAELSRRMERLEARAAGRQFGLVGGSDRAAGEAGRFLRALTVASLTPVRAMAGVVTAFTDAIIEGVQQGDAVIGQVDPRRGRAPGTTLVGHAYAGFADAINQSLQIPKQTVDRFYETYNGDPPAREPDPQLPA
jgi:hypothetical protein